jgi:cell wall-associated NlpC family hydrolase
MAVLREALTQEGVPYVFGGDTPSGGFDCSGIVYWAALQVGISSMPRDTFEMLAQGVSSGLLVQVSDPQQGDLAFFGDDHVEIYIQPGETFGAQQPGTDVGYHAYGGGYEPTAYYEIT